MSATDYDHDTIQWTTEGGEDGFDNVYYHEQDVASSSKIDPSQNMKTLSTPQSPAFKTKPMTIRVDDPQKGNAFVTYRIFTMTCLANYLTNNRPVRRRFRDFVWLHDALSIEFPTCVIPPLPEKHRLKFIQGDRFDSMFIEQRRLGLQWFMDRIARHPYLQASRYTRLFLESTDFTSDKSIQTKSASVFTSFFKTTGKVKKPEDKFEEMKETIDKFQDNLQIVEKLYSKMGKREQMMETNYNQFASSIRELSGLETHVDQPLKQLAECVETYASASKIQKQQEELLFLNDLHELLNYCNAVKAKLIERDNKQVTFEDMSIDLQSIVFERERTLYPGKNFGNNSGMNITEFMTDKMTDTGKARSEKVIRLEFKISQLEKSVAKANDENKKYSTQMIKEYKLFKQAKETELKQSLAAYADSHIEFYKKSISLWENVLPILDQIQ